MCERQKPKILAEDMILCDKLIQQGSEATTKRLARAKKKGLYPKTESPADCSDWWKYLKEGKNKDKMAMVMMASQYPQLAKQVLQLDVKSKSQEEEIILLKLKLQQWEEENTQLKSKVYNNSSKVSELEHKTNSQKEQITSLRLELLQCKEENAELNSQLFKTGLKLQLKTDSQKKEIDSLKKRVEEQNAKNEQLKDEIANYKTCFDSSKNLLVPRGATWKISVDVLLKELPDLQYDHSNYEFWSKIKNWLGKGDVDPQCAFKLVRMKCPLKAWQAIEKNFDKEELTETAFSNPAMMGRLWEKLWNCASEALGPGTKSFEEYYHRRQAVDESFAEYIQEKFRLYCSYGVDKVEPNKNDLHFLYNVVEKAAKHYQTFLSQFPKSYTELLNKVVFIDHGLMPATVGWTAQCLNCHRKGHTFTNCRKPGGGAEADPNQCYTCGEYGHWARHCPTYY